MGLEGIECVCGTWTIFVLDGFYSSVVSLFFFLITDSFVHGVSIIVNVSFISS